MPASSARAFGDSVGVTVRFAWNSTSYGKWDKVEQALRELGVRYVTDGFCSTCEYQIERMNRLAAMGIKANIGVSGLNAGVAKMEQSLKVIRDRLGNSVISLTAPNEPDISGDPLWAEHARLYQAQLYARVKGDPALRHLPVLGPPLVYAESRQILGDISANLDRGNIHPYPGGMMPMTRLWREKELAKYVSGDKPLVATETGYHDDLTYTGAHRGAPGDVTANYTPRALLEAFRFGIERTYIFQLIDPFSPEQMAERGSPPSHNAFGLLRWDYSRRPAFNSVRNLLRMVDADSAPVTDPGGLHLGLVGAGADVRQLLLRSADGSYALVLWRQVNLWNRDSMTRVTPAPDDVEVQLGDRIALAQRFDPVSSDAETARWQDPQRIPVTLAGAPVVLRLTPARVETAPGAPAAKERDRIKLARTKRRQRLGRRLTIKVACARPCATVLVKGRLVLRRGRHHRSFKLRPVKKARRAPVVVLRLRIPARARRAAIKTLKRGGSVRARVKIVARSKRGAKLDAEIRTIALRR